MAAIPSLHLPLPNVTRSPVRAPTWLVLVCLLAAVSGMAVAQMAPPREIDPDLAVLLRAMAAIKALLVVGAIGIVAWRFEFSTAPHPSWAFAYGAALAAMSFATALIWMSAFIGLAALLFHAGLFGGLFAALRDDRIAVSSGRPISRRS